jgi:hypothetical protein
VLGYVAPQNKFELRLPLPAQWNGRFHLTPCAGFCGAVNGNACSFTLARGYASITGNGGHDSPEERPVTHVSGMDQKRLAPRAGFEPATLRLTG